jgi:hypothetical protein
MIRKIVSATLVIGLSAVFAADASIIGGERNGFSWEARNTIIGQTPTSDILPPSNTIGGGDPLYKPTADKDGTVALIMEYSNGDRFICSGSLLNDGRSIATAAHCVSSGGGVKDADLVKTTAYFYTGNPDERTVDPTVGAQAIEISEYFVEENYTGEVIDQNDIAVLRLSQEAPASATRYDLYTQDLTGEQFNVAGYGTRSTVGGASGNTPPAGARTGFLREGDNIYDYAWGDSLFDGFFTDIINGENFFGTADIEFSFISDFDNGLAAQSQADRVCAAVAGAAACEALFGLDNGLGAREVGIAGGDSGGPGFINGMLASINSYGLTFGPNFGDFGGQNPNTGSFLNAGWGELSGYVPIFIHTDFIRAAMVAITVSEPSTWAILIVGFGLVGAARRRRTAATA